MKFLEVANGLPVEKPINKVITSIKDIPELNISEEEMGKLQITEEIQGFRLALIPLKILTKNPIQPGNRTELKNLKGLNESINLHGLLQPILIAQYKSKFFLIDGDRRASCYYINGTPYIVANIRKSTRRDILTHFIECNDPKNVKQIKKKDYLLMYIKRNDAPLPKNVTRDLIFIVDIFGKDYINFMATNNMATGTIKTCVKVGREIGLESKKELKDFIKWAIDKKSIYFIKSFSRIQRDEKESGNASKILLNSFKNNEQLVVNIE